VTVGMTKDTIIAKQEEAMIEKGMSDEQIEQALKVMSGPFMIVTSAIGSIFFIVVVLLLFSFVVNLLLPIFDGIRGFKIVFSIVCFSALIKVPGTLLRLILIAITKSPFVTTSLALVIPNLAKDSFVYQLLASFDFFIIWEMILVALGISITNEIKKQNAYILVFLVWAISVIIGILLGVMRGPGG
ncbi:YIP1 family protein, partial [candidate division WOR-3 bacterium]|nr:YIP1 family protein [candidate division WOR-3 bacterium]